MNSFAPRNRLRLSAHLGYLFTDLPFEKRFAAAANAGFRAIEFPDPYRVSSSAFRHLCEQNELGVAQIALPNGVTGAAAKGFAALPGRASEFESALEQAIDFAKAVGCRLIHPMAGISAASEPSPQWDVYISNLRIACAEAAEAGLEVIIEAISARGVPGYFINSLELACEAIDRVGSPNLLLMLDTFHASEMGVDLPLFIASYGSTIGHVQIADWPGRNEPGTGEIDFDAIFEALGAGGFNGHVGLEYIPTASGPSCFDWIAAFENYLEPLEKTRSPKSDNLSIGATTFNHEAG